MKTLALIGAGSHAAGLHGRAYAHLLAEQPGRFAIAGVCDLDARRAAELGAALGCESLWSDYAEMVERLRPDAVVAVTPIALTFEIASSLAGCGIPLVVEKPPGADYDQALRLAETLAAAGATHMVSFNRRFAPPLRWLFEQGLLPWPQAELLTARMTRRGRMEADFVYGTGLHMIDAARCMLGDPAGRLTAAWSSGREGAATTAQVDFAGVRAELSFAPDCGVHGETIELVGPGRSICVDFHAASACVRCDGRVEAQFALPADQPPYVADGNLAEARSLLDSLDGLAPWRPQINEVLDSVRLAWEIQRGVWFVSNKKLK